MLELGPQEDQTTYPNAKKSQGSNSALKLTIGTLRKGPVYSKMGSE